MEVVPILAKRILISILTPVALAGMMLLTATQANAEYTLITDREIVDGCDYTASSALAKKLDDIFDGDASIYADLACTRLVDTTLGTSPVKNNGVYMYVEPVDGMATNIGTSCWIYANGVYYTLFGEATGNGAGENSEKLALGSTATRSMTYENFKAWGVRQGVGALVRASGHSMIVLGYDEDTLTILDGNGNGRGLVSISEKSWDYYSSYVEYIIQPKDAHYTALYNCGACGDDLSWALDEAGTLTISGSGNILYPGWWNYKDKVTKIVIDGDAIGIGAGMFSGCRNVTEIVFTEGVPTMAENAWMGITATARYPASKSSWTENTLYNYGGMLSWEPYNMTELKITSQPKAVCDQATTTVSIAAEGDGLCYNWYYKDGTDSFVPIADTGTSALVMESGKAQGRQVLCIIEDQYGNFVMSEGISL